MAFSSIYKEYDRLCNSHSPDATQRREQLENQFISQLQNEAVAWLLERYAVDSPSYGDRLLDDLRRFRFAHIGENNDDRTVEELEEMLQDVREVLEYERAKEERLGYATTYVSRRLLGGMPGAAIIQDLEQTIEARRQRWVAVAMGRHRRLGANTTLGPLEPELFRAITERNGHLP
jgi:hypothetical protein